MNNSELNINEIFYSLQGEAREVGLPTVFVRLTGCPLRCTYCDTEYAFKGNNLLRIDDIIAKIKSYQTKLVCVTGGEPLAQINCHILLDRLVKENYQISLETSGSIDIKEVNPRVSIVMDVKTPDSGEADKNRYKNIEKLQAKDQLKFVIGSKSDFDWSVNILNKYPTPAGVLFSPTFGIVAPTQLADWILERQLNVRLQLQLHKILWGDQQGK
ncbi:7-carboxy-7-deazaguanine synthase (EC [Bathymodiolus thermophilus thioautotrophic gill symbiont]|uniref:7-carboxy-7-deazaguanine synthase n=1 Tax=Bathymodiolus thermophilus thioautotrophic gill symbiont TaxID=2360 RepID=A0A1J5TWR0_9GAMM|nr:7-carboxy-7-deazaguanine synthase QueE [Bathymodiolus thermophilus thioautotrophic gill symbiont]OIR25280.1 7-carboxy-7-deazaguanine synthase QueE [Bathymodiolus thermophilus thioautotrophic gill symbiont]CAB5495772.1 7-carboxy-7-deazaguanine synthase (EC [Bathymodiolus thermophilus thioautotrophic gill symbiont]CAB5505210.1 7-carboxy-7-deazaguanine synthase (EC [Bathymodiolus thermophilus thioautotrophic gill symbiont]